MHLNRLHLIVQIPPYQFHIITSLLFSSFRTRIYPLTRQLREYPGAFLMPWQQHVWKRLES